MKLGKKDIKKGAFGVFTRLTSALLLLTLILTAAVGCGKADSEDKTTVVCTVFPIYDWVRNTVGDSEDIAVKLLADNGADLHSYRLTVDDVIEIREAELIVRIGGESDSFMNELLGDNDPRDLQLMNAEGVTLRHMSKETHIHEEGDHHDHATDEHIWLSLKNASAAVNAICSALSDLDGANADYYRANADNYIARLNALDGEYKSAVAAVDSPKVIFADRFPFVYITDDYGIEYSAAFEGCTTETDASFDTVIRLANKLDLWNTGCICVTESSDGELAKRVIDASKSKDAKTVILDSMQSVTADDIESGKTYLGVMEANLGALKTAIGA